MELILVRHGLPEEGGDPPLTPAGVKQAERVARRLASEGVDHIVSSPMRRAIETAIPLSERVGLEIEIVEALAEADRNAPAYFVVERFRREHPDKWREFIADPLRYLGVDPLAFCNEVIGAFEQLIAQYPGQKVAVFNHALVTNAFIAHILGLDPTKPKFAAIAYCSITRIRTSRSGQRTLIAFNDTGHFAKEGN
ncbi:MAG: histidine phosphatase family protein [Ardenticatenaceae bacterium]